MDQDFIITEMGEKPEIKGETIVEEVIAREVEGDLKVSFGPRESFIFGTVAGLVAGLTYYLLRRLQPGR